MKRDNYLITFIRNGITTWCNLLKTLTMDNNLQQIDQNNPVTKGSTALVNKNTQIETVEEAANYRADGFCDKNSSMCTNIPEKEIYREIKNSFKAGLNWQKQQDEAKYKELLDSHNELLELLKNSRPLMQPREYCKGYDYLILDGRIENAINKAKNIKQ